VCVERIVADRWHGVRCEEDVVEHPNEDDFVRALLALDARSRTILHLSARNKLELTIGGGAGKYVIYASLPDNEFWNLLSDPAAVGTIVLNAGGQEGDFPARRVVDQTRALQAGKVFLKEGRLDLSLPWEKRS
jgi:hypothetical protein